MSDEQKPRAEWIFPEEPKSNKGRVWLIVGLVVAVVVIIGTVLFFVIPRKAEPTPTPSPTSGISSPSPTPWPSASATATTTPVPSSSPTPVTTQPPLPDPDLETFAGHVQGWLNDASTGLRMVLNLSSQEASQVVDTLQGDADRLSGSVAPSSISEQWYAAAAGYAMRLSELRSAVDSGGAIQAPVDSANAALNELRNLAGR